MKNKFGEYDKCELCPRKCGVNRTSGERGLCGEKSVPRIGRAALHLWEEPCVSGEKGSGTVFFSGCTLRCCYCQNYNLSRGEIGEEVSAELLCDIFLKLQEEGAHNINLVTAEHFTPHIKEAIFLARKGGLEIPVVLNSSGYVSEETITLLKDCIDIFLVDFKYMDHSLAREYSAAKDYPDVVKTALREMVFATGNPQYDENGMMQKGVIVRHLCLPGHKDDSKRVIEYVFKEYGERVVLSIMSQYTPIQKDAKYENLKRTLGEDEYEDILGFCMDIGIENAYIQEGGADSESFIPEFGKENIIL